VNVSSNGNTVGAAGHPSPPSAAACYSRAMAGPGDRGFIVQAAERTVGGRTEVDIFGRLESGETFAVVERRRRPLFHVRESDLAAARQVLASYTMDAALSAGELRTMDGERTVRVEMASLPSLQKMRDALHRAGVRTYEADVKPSARLLMDRRIHGALSVAGPWRKGRRVNRVYEDPDLAPAEHSPALTLLSLDIETDPAAKTVYAVGIAFEDARAGTVVQEVLLNASGTRAPAALQAPSAALRSFTDERELLLEVRRRIVDLDPDVITGWNVVDFDIRVLARRFAALGLPFDIGRTDAPASFLAREDDDGITRWKRSRAIVPGRQVVDGLWLVRLAGMGLEDYRLETVAQALLGRGKRPIAERPDETGSQAVERLYREDPAALSAYCLQDATLVLDILRQEGLLDLAVAKSLLIGTPLEQTWMSVASFEFLYMEHLHERGIVAPTLGTDQEPLDRAPGGGIITPRAGLYENVMTFDFRSLYPSLIRTFNIDPLTWRRRPGPAGDEPITAPNGARFGREPGILPGILDRFFASRDEARRGGNVRASYAYKIVMNSFYGVLGTPGCRFAASALAGAITTFGQSILYWARDLVAAEGHDVIYGDTDSLFVVPGHIPAGTTGSAGAVDPVEMGNRIAALVNERLTEHVRGAWGVQSRMELEFEGVYARFFLPPMRTASPAGGSSGDEEDGETRGRAKGYAGLLPSGQIEIKGMEAVRHDWTPLAQNLQRDLLAWVFSGVPAAEIAARVRARVRELRDGLRDGELAYRKILRKPVEAYTRSSPPHARAAALLPPEDRTGLIRYVWTTEGPQPEARRTAPADHSHYVEKQVRPIVESIAPFIGLDAKELFADGGQLNLFQA
jgi:DNA polymerase II